MEVKYCRKQGDVRGLYLEYSWEINATAAKQKHPQLRPDLQVIL